MSRQRLFEFSTDMSASSQSAIWKHRINLPSHEDNPRTEHGTGLLIKKPEDSLVEVLLPFSTDVQLREEYISYYRRIRFGKILEDIDVFSYQVALEHAGPEAEKKYAIVTAGVDRLQILESCDPFKDVIFKGQATWVGKSSMEIRCELQQQCENTWKPVCVATLLMVALDRATGRPIPVNRLLPETDLEKERFSFGEERQRQRKEDTQKSVQKAPPNSAEMWLLHNLIAESKKPPKDSAQPFMYMSDTQVSSTLIMHPQKRNIHGKIFGGYLLRVAFELSWSCACIHLSSYNPYIVAVDDVHFVNSVNIGAIIALTARVVYVPDNQQLVQVRVVAEDFHVEAGTRQVTTVFSFTFAVNPNGDLPARKVIPRMYEEALEYIEGQRRYERAKEFAAVLSAEGYEGEYTVLLR